MCEKVGCDFKDWLILQYWDKERATRDISTELYGTEKNSPNILGWMKRLEIPTRSRTDAVALQWKDNHERRKQQSKWAEKKFAIGGTVRDKIIKTMQTEEYKEKQRISKTGKLNGMYGMYRENNPAWNPEKTDEERLIDRKYREYKEWRVLVYKRDDYTCQVCKDDTGGNLVAHHLNGYNWDKEARTDVNNGVTLCEPCHKEFHSIYGYGDNDLFQFSQFQTSKTLTV